MCITKLGSVLSPQLSWIKPLYWACLFPDTHIYAPIDKIMLMYIINHNNNLNYLLINLINNYPIIIHIRHNFNDLSSLIKTLGFRTSFLTNYHDHIRGHLPPLSLFLSIVFQLNTHTYAHIHIHNLTYKPKLGIIVAWFKHLFSY